MKTSLAELLATQRPLLADGATGTNYFAMGLTSGEPPEFWITDHPDRVTHLHQAFVDAGSDIILTNTFGANRSRLALHKAEDQCFELSKRAAELAREVADACPRPIVVAGSVGPTGELFVPLGALEHDAAVAIFEEQIRGLQAGGADVAWIETMSAIEEMRAAAQAAINVGMPYVVTCSFDTAGRTMMGMMPGDLTALFDGLAVKPLAVGANCGVGASDILVSLLNMTESDDQTNFVSKGNCGVPRFAGTDIVYSGTPELMGDYARLAVDAGARIIGGCCGTSPQHLMSMRNAIDHHVAQTRPTLASIIATIGPLANTAPTTEAPTRSRRRSGTSED